MKAVAVSVVFERVAFIRLARHHANDGTRPVPGAYHAELVDIITVMEDEIELLGRDAAERSENTILISLDGRDPETQLGHGSARGREGAHPPDPAALAADRELIEVVTR